MQFVKNMCDTILILKSLEKTKNMDNKKIKSEYISKILNKYF